MSEKIQTKKNHKKDDTKVTIVAGGKTIKTTAGVISELADRIGHNSENMVADETTQKRLRSLVAKIEKLNEERASISASIAEVYAEAKGTGFKTKVIRKIVAERKMKIEDRREQEELMNLYKAALGMDI